jgi:hypothetical protein
MALWRRRSDKDLTLRLRPYSKADLSALHALDQVCFDPDIAYSRAELEAFLNTQAGLQSLLAGVHKLLDSRSFDRFAVSARLSRGNLFPRLSRYKLLIRRIE